MWQNRGFCATTRARVFWTDLKRMCQRGENCENQVESQLWHTTEYKQNKCDLARSYVSKSRPSNYSGLTATYHWFCSSSFFSFNPSILISNCSCIFLNSYPKSLDEMISLQAEYELFLKPIATKTKHKRFKPIPATAEILANKTQPRPASFGMLSRKPFLAVITPVPLPENFKTSPLNPPPHTQASSNASDDSVVEYVAPSYTQFLENFTLSTFFDRQFSYFLLQ